MSHCKARRNASGFTLVELVLVILGGSILITMAAPVLGTMVDGFRVVLAGQEMAIQMHYARMKAVSSNEEFHVNFPNGQNYYQVESAAGAVVAGPFFLPAGVSWNNGCSGTDVSFGGKFVAFLPTGNIPLTGNGSGGRARIVNQAGSKIDVVVNSGGIIRQTPAYSNCTAPF
jgi:type II secretory pathway pseudopilin PulG